MYFNSETIRDKKRIKAVLNEAGLSCSTDETTFLPGGATSFAIKINDYVIRFPKSDDVCQSLRQEAKLSKFLQKHLPFRLRKKITQIRWNEDVSYPFSCHKMIKGKICDHCRGETDHNTLYDNLSPSQQDLLAADIADFLTELHTIKKNNTNPMSEDWNCFIKDDFDQDACRNALLKYSADKIDLNKFTAKIPSCDFVFAHNDMSGSNLIIDEKRPRVLQGVIDFANAGFMPRINEFFPYYKIHRGLARRIIVHYNDKNGNIINQTAIDYLALGYFGYVLNSQEKRGGKPSAVLLEMLKRFIDDL